MRKTILLSFILALGLAAQANAGNQPSDNNVPSTMDQATTKVKQVASDTTITSAVKAKLLRDSRTSGLNIHVKTNKGVVKLWGVAKSNDEKLAAEKIALDTEDVVRVINRIKVKP